MVPILIYRAIWLLFSPLGRPTSGGCRRPSPSDAWCRRVSWYHLKIRLEATHVRPIQWRRNEVARVCHSIYQRTWRLLLQWATNLAWLYYLGKMSRCIVTLSCCIRNVGEKGKISDQRLEDKVLHLHCVLVKQSLMLVLTKHSNVGERMLKKSLRGLAGCLSGRARVLLNRDRKWRWFASGQISFGTKPWLAPSPHDQLRIKEKEVVGNTLLINTCPSRTLANVYCGW